MTTATPQRNNGGKMEYRTFDVTGLKVETREEGQPEKIVGHAAVFNVIASSGWFREQVAPGAFTKSIGQDDIRALFNHNPDYVLGRNKAGTLTLREDDKGLYVEITPPDTQFAKDLSASISRGDISQMSFGFEIIKESREVGEGNELSLFTLEEVKLWDVSPVTFPFYVETDVSINSRQAWADEQRRAEAPPPMKKNMIRRKLELKYGKA